MQPNEFLALVLPSEGQGHYCTFELPSRQQTFFEDVSSLANTCELISLSGKNSFFAMAAFRTAGTRVATNAVAIRDLFFDIDCGAGKAYSTKSEAIAALYQFLSDTGLDTLGMPWLVDSGGGVHGHFPFYDDISPEDWRPLAEAFKRTAQRMGLKIDMTVTADAARVLRMPGTLNYKYDPPRQVKLKLEGAIFNPEDIAKHLDKVTAPSAGSSTAIALAGRPPMAANLSPTMKALAQNSVTYFKNIMVRTMNGTGCGQIKHYVENAQEDGMEPIWRGMLSLAKVCDDGAKACVKLTAMHPYTEARMHQKLAEIKGPYSCMKLDSENPGVCGSCPHWGTITNPLVLGRDTALATEPPVYEIPEQDQFFHPGSHLTAPPAPRGYSYGDKGGVYRKDIKLDANGNSMSADVMIIPYNFFLLELLHEGSEHTARFVAIRAKTVTNIELPLSVASAKDSCIKQLYSQNIMAAFGAGNDKHLWDYVRACIEEASSADRVLRIPANYGWQHDNSFAIGDRVIQLAGDGYNFPSKGLKNLVSATKPKGSLGDWQRFVQLIQDKGLWDILGMMAVSFGAPLMEFASAGTPFLMLHAASDKSGNGKSLALQLAASVWGHPIKYPVPPDTSKTTMMQRMGMLGSLPFLSDEVTALQRRSKGEFIPDTVFAMSQGMHKIKGSNAANAEIVNELTWRAQGLITSNEPAMEKMLTSRDTSSNGEFYRMLEWHAVVPIVWTAAERELEHTLENNYGVAGRVYAEWLVNNRDTAAEITARCIAKVRKLLNATDVERFWVNGLGCKLAGMILAGPKYSNVFNFDTKQIFDKAYRVWVVNARNLMSTNTRSAEDLLHAFTREHHGNLVRLDPKRGPTAMFDTSNGVSANSTRGKVAGRVEYNVNPGWIEYYLELATFKRYCAERNHGYQSIKAELGVTMAVEEVRRDLLAKTGGPAMRVLCLRVSQQIVDDAP